VSHEKHIHILEMMISSRSFTDAANQAMEAAITALRGAPAPACAHENTKAGYDHHTCLDCGAFKADSGWRFASGLWFKNRGEALFYKTSGRLPESLP
jgi:hypothetical protein